MALIVGRAIAGAGGAGIASGAYTIIATSSPEAKTRIHRTVEATYGTASVINSPLGGVFTNHLGACLLSFAYGVNEWFQRDLALTQKRLLACLYAVSIVGGLFMFLYYLPVNFQSISGISLSESGIHNMRLVTAITLFSILSTGPMSTFGHHVPIMIISSVIETIGVGLIYTLGVGSSPSHWMRYQALTGIGPGLGSLGFQVPIIIAQASVDPENFSSASTLILFFQPIGGSFFSQLVRLPSRIG
ncbi:MAG: hypothetical protein Q9181_004943 [Wetmoreana brouardii]